MASKNSRRKSTKAGAPKTRKKILKEPGNNDRLLGFAGNVRALRILSDMTTEQLAEEADLSVNEVSAVERGEKNVRLSTFFKLAAALNVPPAVLLDGAFRGKKDPSLYARAFPFDFDSATPEQQRDALRRLREEVAKLHHAHPHGAAERRHGPDELAPDGRRVDIADERHVELHELGLERREARELARIGRVKAPPSRG